MSHGQIYFLDSFLRKAWYGQGHIPCANALNASVSLRKASKGTIMRCGTALVHRPNLGGI
jgi:hypothetical protein